MAKNAKKKHRLNEHICTFVYPGSDTNKSDITGDGKIHRSIQYAVWCATCDAIEYYEEYRNKEMAIESYRSLNWRKTKLGWQCFKYLGV